MYNVCRVMVTDSFSPRIELLVEFVDGVTRLELMKKADELKVVANTTYSNTFEMLVTVVLVH